MKQRDEWGKMQDNLCHGQKEELQDLLIEEKSDEIWIRNCDTEKE